MGASDEERPRRCRYNTPEPGPQPLKEATVDTRSLAQPSRAVPDPTEGLEHAGSIAARVLRGQELYAEHAGEIRFEDGVWLVPSQHDTTSVYEVRLGRRGEDCECRDFERRHRSCKHVVAARIAEAAHQDHGLYIDYPVEEELLAAVEYTLSWFEAWEEHACHDHDFGGEHAVMKKLRRAIRFAEEA
jgi:hypothetical protein